MSKQPMSPTEFDAAKREFERRCHWMSSTSGKRSNSHNAEVGGKTNSKHLIGMAQDYKCSARRDDALDIAEELGFWWKPYDWGCHLQGLPSGDVPQWWLDKYGETK